MDLTQVFIVAIVFVTCYKAVEVFVNRKERINLVEKLDFAKENNVNLSHLFGNDNIVSNKAIMWGCLLVGIGLGVLVGYIISYSCGLYSACGGDLLNNISEQLTVIYASSILHFGGAGLLVSYCFDKKTKKLQDK